MPLRAEDFTGQVGPIDAAQLDENWYLLRPGEFPIIPLEGVTVSVIDCGGDCPDPVRSDPDGRFRLLGLASPARLRFDPPECAEGDQECEPLEPREVERASGARTALGAKWPAGIEDTMLRYMPSVAGALYVKREGEIPGLPGAAGAANDEIVWVNGRHGWEPFRETSIFLHDLTHVYDHRLRTVCLRENREVNGYVLHENWLRAYDADRIRMDSLGIPLGEADGYNLTGWRRGAETLAWFSQMYYWPNDLVREWRKDHPSLQFMTHDELEQYAPHRYRYFEKIVLERYLKEQSWLGSASTGERWPGMCRAPRNEWVSVGKYLLVPSPLLKRSFPPPAAFECGFLDLP